MLQIPKAGGQTLEQDPQEMRCIYFSLEYQINLVQASQTPGNNIKMHSKEVFRQVFSVVMELKLKKFSLSFHNLYIYPQRACMLLHNK